jgi:hypothetical protein
MGSGHEARSVVIEVVSPRLAQMSNGGGGGDSSGNGNGKRQWWWADGAQRVRASSGSVS